MKIKLIVDFLNPKSKEMVDYLVEYKKENELDLEVVAYDELFRSDNNFNKAYYGLYYANRMGNTLEYVKCVLDRKYNDGADISKMDELASCYEEIGYAKDDFIDALIDGDYQQMHEVFQEMYKNKGICEGGVCIAYNGDVEEIYDIHQLKKALAEIEAEKE